MKFVYHLKKIYCLFFTLLMVFVLSSGSKAQNSLTSEQWQEDVTFLRNTVETKYPNLFSKVTKQQWLDAANDLYGKIPSLSENEIKLGLVKLVAMFKYGHTRVGIMKGHSGNFTPACTFIPARFYYFSDGLYMSRISVKYKEALGGRVLKIGDTEIGDVLRKFRDVISSENEEFFLNNLQYYLNIPEFLEALHITDTDKKVKVTYEKDGKQSVVEMEAEKEIPDYGVISLKIPDKWIDSYEGLNKSSSVLWMKEPEKFRYFEYLPDSKILYVRHSAVQDAENETIAQFFDKVFKFVDTHEINKFVLDIRLNGGGNNYLNKPVITGIIRSRNINRYGHLFVITGKATFSAAQNLTNGLEKYTEAIFVGEPTAENVNFYGDTKTETLPNSKLNLRLSWLWWQDMDPRDKREWTAPQLAALMSFNDYKTGYDSAMSIIENFNDETPLLERVKELISSGKYDEALHAALDFNKDPAHRYFTADIEAPLNTLGYEYLGQNKFEEANKILYINMKLYPESANAYDSYAESLLKMGKKEEALKYYEIASSKDPGPVGDNSRKMIETLKSGK